MEDRGLMIPERDWRKLLAAASGDSALLYLFLRAGGDLSQAQIALRMDRTRLDCAVTSLQQLGLWQEAPKVLRPAAPPVYTEADLSRELHQESGFPRLIGEVQRRLGKVLSTEELKVLLSIYDYLGMPAEVISLLISYCLQRARNKGSLRQPSIRTIEKEAYHWADLGIDTMEEAASYIQLQLERQKKIGALRTALHLTDRKLTPTEERYLSQWLDWGFGNTEILMAYEKTCLNTGGLKWAYMNSILSRWNAQGLHDKAAIEAGDKVPTKAAQSQKPTQWEKDAIARMMGEETSGSQEG